MPAPGALDTLPAMADRDRVTAPTVPLRTTAGILELGGRPWLMGIVNATPDSFSDGRVRLTLDERVELARSLLGAGADMIDIGGESGVTNHPPVAPAEEIERVVPLIGRVSTELGALVSVGYTHQAARQALARSVRDGWLESSRQDRKSTRLNSSHRLLSRMPSSA